MNKRESQKKWRESHKEYIQNYNKEYGKKYREEHREEILDKMKKYYLKHKEKLREYRNKYYKEHKEHMSKTHKIWIAKNRDKCRQYNKKHYYKYKEEVHTTNRLWQQSPKGKIFIRKRNAQLRALTKDLSIKIVQEVYEDNIKKFKTLTCIYCLNPIPFGKDTLEHKQPLTKGGTNKKDNLGIACQRCNFSKGAKTEEQFIDYLKGERK